MNEEQNEPVFMFDGNDEAMQAACSKAKETFKYFWREMSWERRRIIQAFDLMMVKLPFNDGKRTDDKPSVEHMWVNEVDFDGENLSGVLMNSPNWLTSVRQGDAVQVPFAHLEDWMIAADGVAFGAFTVNAMRVNMSKRDRKAHDEAWGLDFGDPTETRINPFQKPKKKPGLLSRLFGGKKEEPTPEVTPTSHQDHNMCVNMLPKIEEGLQQDATPFLQPDENGSTMLHFEALAGNLGAVKLLVKYGADIHAKTHSGKTAADLANTLGWDEIAEYLQNAAKS